MAEQLAGFSFWELSFTEEGSPEDKTATGKFLKEIAAAKPGDLFIFSHGWNNDSKTARILYQGFFGEMRKLMDNPTFTKRRPAKIAGAGVIWPSILWPEEESTGGAAGIGAGGISGDLSKELKKVFRAPAQQKVLAELLSLLGQRKPNEQSLKEFKTKLGQLMGRSPGSTPSPDNLEKQGLAAEDGKWREIFEALSDQETAGESSGGAAGLGDAFGRLWEGAKGALRLATYWQMKERAGVVGKMGLGPLIGQLHEKVPALRVHLLGHSFGARLMSYTLAGLPRLAAGDKSPVKSLFLLQGAFSHFTFAEKLPFDTTRKGDLAGMAAGVDGPLLTTHSLKDLAVGSSYPLASIVSRQDAANEEDITFRWGAMGHDGAQAVNAKSTSLGKPGTSYAFEVGKWLNLDGNQVIVKGNPPSGAHSDIIHPHTAWAALAAAGIV